MSYQAGKNVEVFCFTIFALKCLTTGCALNSLRYLGRSSGPCGSMAGAASSKRRHIRSFSGGRDIATPVCIDVSSPTRLAPSQMLCGENLWQFSPRSPPPPCSQIQKAHDAATTSSAAFFLPCSSVSVVAMFSRRSHPVIPCPSEPYVPHARKSSPHERLGDRPPPRQPRP